MPRSAVLYVLMTPFSLCTCAPSSGQQSNLPSCSKTRVLQKNGRMAFTCIHIYSNCWTSVFFAEVHTPVSFPLHALLRVRDILHHVNVQPEGVITKGPLHERMNLTDTLPIGMHIHVLAHACSVSFCMRVMSRGPWRCRCQRSYVSTMLRLNNPTFLTRPLLNLKRLKQGSRAWRRGRAH